MATAHSKLSCSCMMHSLASTSCTGQPWEQDADGMPDVVCREVLICLLPFAACFFLGTGIGVGVGHDEDPWIDVVLYGLIAGLHT